MRVRPALRWLLAALLSTGTCGEQAAAAAQTDEAPAATGAIRFYQRYISSLREGHCPFDPSCSEYAAQAIAVYGVVKGSARAADRLVRCNSSAARSYSRGPDGRLWDPVDGSAAPGALPRIPRWMLVAGEPEDPPLPATLDPDRRSRLVETVAFALQLERRGDCERASTEYQRAASLAGQPEADAWAFARIGECRFAAAQWSAAESAFLTSGMLAPGHAERTLAVYRAAVCRFDAGAYAACERVLADSSAADPAVPADRVAALRGLCALARGGWSFAAGEFRRAASLSAEDEARTRILRLAPFAARGPSLSHRSAAIAGALSAVIPGAGQTYCGRPGDGIRHLLMDSALAWTVVSLARDHRGPAAYLTAGVALPFYLGNVLGAQAAARRHDRQGRLRLLRNAINDSTR